MNDGRSRGQPAALRRAVAWALAAFLGGGCGEDSADGTGDPAGDTGRPVVHAVNYPLAYFAERLGGDAVEVVFPVPGDVDPAFWEPSAEEVAAFQSADVILLNGATYAKWVPKASLPPSRVVDTSRGFRDALITIGGGARHTHGPGGEHEHSDTAFTTWLDLELARGQADAVADALIAAGVDSTAVRARQAELATDLHVLDTELARAGITLEGTPLLASHPVYQYLARRYALDVTSVLWEPGTAPTENQWRELHHLLRDRPASFMLWEREPLPDTAARLAELGVGVVVFDPCGNRPESGDLLAGLGAGAADLAALNPATGAPGGAPAGQ